MQSFRKMNGVRLASNLSAEGIVDNFVGRNKASLDGLNAYRLEAYASIGSQPIFIQTVERRFLPANKIRKRRMLGTAPSWQRTTQNR
jgi:hypothetical protein